MGKYMHTILVPIDGSKQARRALKYAIKLLNEGFKAEIHIIHIQPIVLPLGELPLIDADLIAQAQQEQGEKILKSAGALLNKAAIAYHQHFEIGPIASRIVNYAKKHGCDTIVMGSRGMGALGNLLLGSIASQVIHLAEIPVTLIK
jgi:nucleotide-binding universal stress UspA family protein